MIIGACSLDLYLPECHSLKEKRMLLNRLRGRIIGKFNVALAEVGQQDLWQRATLAVVSVSNERAVLDRLFQQVAGEVDRTLPGALLRYETEYL